MGRVLAWLALPFVAAAMLVAPFLGLHFCPLEAAPVVAAATALPWVRIFFKNRRKPHCCAEHAPTIYTLEVDVEEDGRYIAEILDVPGALAYGATPEEARKAAIAIAEKVRHA